MSEAVLMKRLMALDFMAVDLALFLDTHPDDIKAVETYKAIVDEGKKARKMYEAQYGPLTMKNGVMDGRWCWANDPWPWQKEANIDLRGE